jgi:TonB family protein
MKKILLTLTILLLLLTARAQTADTAKTKTAKTASVEVTIDSPVGGPESEGAVFTSVEQEPEFPGGLNAFSHFLVTNLRYPQTARNNKKQGKVIVTMVIEKDGTVSGVKIARSVCDDLDAEAMRVIKLSPKWKPGIQNGRPVRVAYSVPINFTL